ncbi:hypothetical protein NH288_04745 [Anaerococcus sp. NML200537]|uniref:hypothetical protein n=1 Tax=Anaerococcus sp. NML200537 TaxID=2954485 RepID=UPI002238A619|nr:hypothetical protein [Anaerococcus sp. NML200537]MCW6701391.1 hypothetical protein [Anaerococcus sp. NML200537]
MAVNTVSTNIHERLPIITNTAHCSRALALVERGNIFIGIGKTSPWEGENDEGFVPPEPNPDAENLEELVGMKKADRVSLVVPDEYGDIEYAKIKFKTLTKDEALRQKSRWVLVESTIYYEELPPVAYRQLGVFSRVQAKEGKDKNRILLADDIEDVGILEVLANRKVTTRQSDTKDTFFMVIEC